MDTYQIQHPNLTIIVHSQKAASIAFLVHFTSTLQGMIFPFTDCYSILFHQLLFVYSE